MNVPSSQSVQQQIGQNSNSLVPHSQSAYEIGQAFTHQQALHQQLQQRFASVCSSGESTQSFSTHIFLEYWFRRHISPFC